MSSSSYINQNASTGSMYSTTTLDMQIQIAFDAYNYGSFYIEIPAVLIGLLFNISTIVVFLRVPLQTAPTTRFYYILIAACDIITLIDKHVMLFMFSTGVFAMGAPITWWFVQGVLPVCRASYSTWLVSEMVGNSALVALGAERAMVIYNPFSARSLTVKRAIMGLGAVTIYAIVFCSFGSQSTLLVALPYLPAKVGCWGVAGNSWLGTIFLPPVLLCIYFFPSSASIVISIMIVYKLQQAKAQTASLTQHNENKSQGMNKKEIESCLTLIVMSVVHVIYEIPIAVFRIANLLIPYFVTLSYPTRLLLNAIGMFLYVSVAPLHSVNFIIYSRRINGFWDNVKLLWTCRSATKA